MRRGDQGRKLRTVVTVGLAAVRSGAGVVGAEKDGSGCGGGAAAEETPAGRFCFCGIQVETRNISEAACSPLPCPRPPLGVCGIIHKQRGHSMKWMANKHGKSKTDYVFL